MALETFSSANVDFTTLGSTTSIFTPSGDFVITGITFIGIDLTGDTGQVTLSMGTNSPDFDNYTDTLTSDLQNTGQYQYYSIGGTVNPIVHSGGTFEAVVIVPNSSAATNTQRIDVTGYYL